MQRGTRLVLILVALMALVPLITQSSYHLGNLVVIGLYTIVVVGLGLLVGYTGQVSLGHAAFYGLGAYGSAILTVRLGINPWLALLAAAVITAAIAYLIGVPTLRLSGHFLALATLGAGLIIQTFFNEQLKLTGGPSGISGIPYLSLGGLVFDNDVGYYYLVWVVALLVLWASNNLINSRVGRALRAIDTSDTAAACVGIAVTRYKVQVFVFSAVVASVAGSLYAHYVTFISPSPFGFEASIEFMLMAVIGGMASIWGPLVGSALMVYLTEGLRTLVRHYLPSGGTEYEVIFLGIMLVLVMIFLPQGLVGSLTSAWAGRRFGQPGTVTPPNPAREPADTK